MKRFISILLALVLMGTLGVAAFAEESGSKIIVMELEPDIKAFSYEDGSKISYDTREDALLLFHELRDGKGIFWGQLESGEVRFEENAEGELRMISQYFITHEGLKVETSDPYVVFVDTDKKMHPTGAGEAYVTITDASGNEVSSWKITVTGTSSSNFVLVNECPNCTQDQSDKLHYMSCGHYACDVGREGHGDASCGYAGHYACDEADHSLCFNCQKGLCKGEHGVGVCPHVHTPVHFAWDRLPTCTKGGVERIICSGCGYGAIIQTPPRHAWHPYYNNICSVCHHVRDESDEW